MSDLQREIARWLSFIVSGAAIATFIALFMVFIDSKKDRNLREEYEDRPYKPLMGRVLGVVLAVGFAYYFWVVTPHNLDATWKTLAGAAAILLIAHLSTTILLKWHRKLQLRSRRSGTALRVTLLLMMTSQLAFLWIISADKMEEYWHSFLPWDGTGTPCLAFALAVVSWGPLNLLISDEAAGAQRHLTRRTGALERFFYRAEINATIVLITLRDSKVYAGWIERIEPNPRSEDSFVGILAVKSGYRHRRTKDIHFTTDYVGYLESLPVTLSRQDYADRIRCCKKFVPIALITSVGLYDEKVHAELETMRHPLVRPARFVPPARSPVPPTCRPGPRLV